MARNGTHDAQERAVNVTQWVFGFLAHPDNEQKLRSLMGLPFAPPSNTVKHEIVEIAARFGVQESEIGAALTQFKNY